MLSSLTKIHLPLPPECWDYTCETPYPAEGICLLKNSVRRVEDEALLVEFMLTCLKLWAPSPVPHKHTMTVHTYNPALDFFKKKKKLEGKIRVSKQLSVGTLFILYTKRKTPVSVDKLLTKVLSIHSRIQYNLTLRLQSTDAVIPFP